MAPLSDLDKTLICIRLVMDIVKNPSGNISELEDGLRRSLGTGWSVVSALQWLTGKRSIASLEAVPPDFRYAGLGKPELLSLHAVATETLRSASTR